ncbi:MAG: translation initiation factor IF-3 [Candidatus Liberibacter europaeus]|uniref:Translation initiation factor IF-3 n=1 Tax=Candidatus Liberibacter europaeus TaxID=744859 RepID=A0A2T4VXW6_9HYPH|nr:translation initiation factor IF-3 [Candidatus Liberibacter europaeus]PTL86610.1 MAG: translation initiation factor IF-3 [Candidatus Liberibacter europaeus]
MVIRKVLGSSKSFGEIKNKYLIIDKISHDTPEIIRLVDDTGQSPKEMSVTEALSISYDNNLDLVVINPSVSPPICKMIDLRKHAYTIRKNASEARKKQKTVETKEIKFRPVIDDSDYKVKIKSLTKFLAKGYKVKVDISFRGREIAHKDVGRALFNRIKVDVSDVAKIENETTSDIRHMIMILSSK